MSAKRVLVYGGRGALGSACVSRFKELKWVGKTSFYLSFYYKLSSLLIS